MRRSAVRWSVLALAVVAAAGCCYWAATLERQALDRRRALTLAATDARALQAALADARRALSAMASPGQAAVSWSRQATASIDAARGRLSSLAATEGGASLRSLTERFDRLADAEGRVRENAVGGRTLMASDVAFGEALPHVDAIDMQVAEAMAVMTIATDGAVASARDSQLLALAGALGVLGLAAVLLTPVPVRRKMASAADTGQPGAGETAPGPAADAADDALPLHPAAPWSSAAPALELQPASLIDLAPLAAACDALAHLADGEKLPAALEKVRPALGASGLVVWLADAERRTLQVVASAGYDRRIVERFPAVRVDDSNPTSRAYATGGPVTTSAGAGQPAAIAVPIGGAQGTTGVLSAELLAGRAADLDVQARARIVAAQLATLLEPAAPVDQQASEPSVARAENG